MFTRLFAQSGLSLDRLRALVEVGAAGSIVRAADAGEFVYVGELRSVKGIDTLLQAVSLVAKARGASEAAPRRAP